MLLKKNRLKNKKRIGLIYKKGKKITGKYIIIRTLPSLEKQAKLAFIVSKKKIKKATCRNKIRRILREIVRKKINNTVIKQDIVIEYKGLDFCQEKEKKKQNTYYDILFKEINFLFQKLEFS